ncbi:ComEC/Rec2 family competence protein [Candidatus Paracaedibacter symbiosus]|uniref:ComEC/Rec2 family competence protein n=1 Tax=Candidatus Paracaedibacter symbiosus TaxID=244582 RepID=UPI0018DD249B|nr:ComEC/Rec2 family competence protein [Candidatus Paracaedibacter symbiosus]
MILWWPVAFGLGILGYFSLPTQPTSGHIIATTVIALLFCLRRMRSRFNVSSLAILAFCCGIFVTHVRTVLTDTVMIDQRIKSFHFTGVVADVDYTQRGVRLLIQLKNRPEVYERLQTIRLSLRPDLRVSGIGAEIKGEANLLPFGGIMSESGYNFRRVAYFQGVNATGQLLTFEEIGHHQGQFDLILKGIRWRITDTIMTQFLPDQDIGGIMAALVTGVRGSISNSTRQAFTDAGLAHLLAISGLHLSLIAGFIFLLIRRGLSLSMHLAERYDLKKVAACLTVPFLLFYLLISGVGIPALRAFLMILLAMLAIVLDRNPLSMRLVCFAASVILLIYPESLLSASFQLSFAAVVALIGVYENGWRPFKNWVDRGSFIRKIILYIAGIIATTLIASFATTPFTIAIFQRFSLQGVLGNLVAIPMTGFIIMPLIVLFLLLMPVRLEFLVTPFLKSAIQILITVSHSVASLPGAAIIMPEQPPIFLALFVIGGIWFCLWQQRWRYLGVVPMTLAFFCLKLTSDLKIVIPEREQAIYGFDGERAFCLGCGESGFGQEMFLRQVGCYQLDHLKEGAITMPVGKLKLFLAVEKVPKRHLQTHCAQGDYLLSPRSIGYACSDMGKVLDRSNVQRQGTIIAHIKQDKLEITTSCKLQGCRPWSERKCCVLNASLMRENGKL